MKGREIYLPELDRIAIEVTYELIVTGDILSFTRDLSSENLDALYKTQLKHENYEAAELFKNEIIKRKTNG